MRELKFRARVKGTSVWLYDFGFHFSDTSQVFLGESQLEGLEQDFIDQHADFYDDIRYFDIDVLDEFTGLLDKNGKEIYEGDILRELRGNFMPLWSGKVVWLNEQDGNAVCSYGYYAVAGQNPKTTVALNPIQTQKFEVIGNIYENPELLK